jgi:hypothetical protein
MYFVKVLAGVAVEVYTASVAYSSDDYEITKDQFEYSTIPCRAVVNDDGVTLGEKVEWDVVPDTGGTTGMILPEPSAPTPENIILDTLADHEYRLCLTELGVN